MASCLLQNSTVYIVMRCFHSLLPKSQELCHNKYMEFSLRFLAIWHLSSVQFHSIHSNITLWYIMSLSKGWVITLFFSLIIDPQCFVTVLYSNTIVWKLIQAEQLIDTVRRNVQVKGSPKHFKSHAFSESLWFGIAITVYALCHLIQHSLCDLLKWIVGIFLIEWNEFLLWLSAQGSKCIEYEHFQCSHGCHAVINTSWYTQWYIMTPYAVSSCSSYSVGTTSSSSHYV